MSPTPLSQHNHTALELAIALDRQLPPPFECLLALDVDLQMVPPDAPGTMRRPDLVVVPGECRRRVRDAGGVLVASEVALVVEVLSHGSTRVDRVHKRSEYADAGIPHYWIVDPAEPVSLLACHQAGEFGYADDGVVTGRFTATEPFPIEVDLDSLR